MFIYIYELYSTFIYTDLFKKIKYDWIKRNSIDSKLINLILDFTYFNIFFHFFISLFNEFKNMVFSFLWFLYQTDTIRNPKINFRQIEQF